ncbi:hypothetical protein EOM27_03315 [Candidatus Saccharibacteria bacterium]|nr:hypothetical protein [Candidatus Saccharibacteria bacterium]
MDKIDYQRVFSRVRRDNLKIVKSQIVGGVITDNDLEVKISNHVNRWEGVISKDDIVREMQTTKTVPTFLAKDPSRQNLTEGIAKEYLEQFDEIREVEILSKSGKNSWSIVDGILDKTDNFTKAEKNGHKSIDFRITLNNGKIIFAAHKYTKDTGGAQDNQGNDLLAFVVSADQYPDDDYLFAAIGDGEYYTDGKMDGMRERSSKVIICNTDNFITELRRRGIL